MDQFIGKGVLPNFQRFRDESRVFVTDAGEAQENLEPWIQWVTIHSGLSCAEHGVFHLNEAQKLTKPCLWDLASAAGGKVWICGSMNVRFDTPINGRILPDPWSSADAYPRELNSFFQFVRKQVQEHSNDRAPLSLGEAARFVAFLLSHGLAFSTITSIIQQILDERRTNVRWKRATLLDRMQWDLFKHYFRKDRPAFSTFFVNSTAHFQHCYWRNFEPEHFSIQPSPEEQQSLQDAIAFGYREMDRIVGEALELCGDDSVLMLATGLGQQPYLKMEETGGKLLYRPHDLNAFASTFGLTGVTRATPVMAEQFYLYHQSEADAERSYDLLKQPRLNGEPLFGHVVREGCELLLGCGIFHDVQQDAVIEFPGGKQIRFYDALYLIKDSLKSGMHHGDGILWIRSADRKHSETQRVGLTSVAPTILELLGIAAPGFMRMPAIPLDGRTEEPFAQPAAV